VELGVWAKTQIEKETRIGREVGEQFLVKERGRISRRKSPT
jgi:hypothetical protein